MSFQEAQVLQERARAFLRNAERLMAEEVWDLTAFSIEEYCQLLLKYRLLLKTGTYPRTHSLIRMIRHLRPMTRSWGPSWETKVTLGS